LNNEIDDGVTHGWQIGLPEDADVAPVAASRVWIKHGGECFGPQIALNKESSIF
jgi:hypothetical protein